MEGVPARPASPSMQVLFHSVLHLLRRSNNRSSLALLTLFFAKPLAGVCLLVNKKARSAATSLGLTILLTPLGIYLPVPMLLAAPTDVGALKFFFDTLLFCGAILLLANSIDKEPAVASNQDAY